MKPRLGVTIADLTHRVLLCRAEDTVQDGVLSLKRNAGVTAWASIREFRGQMFGGGGQVIQEGRNAASHYITFRHRADIQISAMAWIYEDRRLSPPRWFKVLGVNDYLEQATFSRVSARLVEEGDAIAAPIDQNRGHATEGAIYGSAAPLPPGLSL